MSSTSTGDASATTTSSAATASSTSTSQGPTSSPLLFFVALGFGVVFTNLWIIVGVKYCFRYNQRNRQLRAMAENGEPIDLANMHGPRRRRREKKLMTMEEVNERFPLIKYKLWRSQREAEGLPTEGGVTAPPSRAASVRSKRDIESAAETRASRESVRPVVAEASDVEQTNAAAAEASSQEPKKQEPEKEEPEKNGPTVSEKVAEVPPASPTVVDADEEDDDPIRTAVAPEMLAAPGDSCAICIDTLEDDDDVRGLSCGHAFHASCVDPWLTSRRACCPLCKADYYIPKPRPEGSEDLNATPGRRSFPTGPQPPWIGSRAPFTGRAFPFLNRGQAPATGTGPDQTPPRLRLSFFHLSPPAPQEAPTTAPRSRLPTFRMPRFGRAPPPPATTEHGVPEEIPTPGELEAGRTSNVVR